MDIKTSDNQEEDIFVPLPPHIERIKEEVVNLRTVPQGPGSRFDSDTVDGIQAFSQPSPNALVALDNSGQFTTGPLARAILVSMLWSN